MNKLYYGDNLPILQQYLPPESVDLIYLDPPFNSNRNYNVLFKDDKGQEAAAQITAFKDTWQWDMVAERTYYHLIVDAPSHVAQMLEAMLGMVGRGQMMAYLVMMTARLIELHRVLKPTGSLYLHCDPTASHYLRLILDSIFGSDNFQSEIIWIRTSSHNSAKRWAPVHDTIFMYSKTRQYVWNKIWQEHKEDYLTKFYRYEDAGRKYRVVDLTGAGVRTGDSGKPWKNINPTETGRHWAVPNKILLQFLAPEEIAQLNSQQKLDFLEEQGLIYWSSKGRPSVKYFLEDTEGVPVHDVIQDISPISSQATERLGYPTQKPLSLLERIILCSSNEGDVVLDPFCGCGTAVAAAQKLDRQWLGIDITHLAIALQKYRLNDMFGLVEKQDYEVIGEPADLASAQQLAKEDRYQFQWWALSLVHARPVGGEETSKKGKKGSDKGIDGLIRFIDDQTGKAKQVLVQVKSGKVKSGDIRDLRGVLERENGAIALFITLEPPTAEMKKEAAAAGFYHSPGWHKEYARLQIMTLEQLLAGEKPQLPPSSGTFKQAGRVLKEGETPQPGFEF